MLRRHRRNSVWYIYIYFAVGDATSAGELNWDNICISICEVRFHALRGMMRALPAAIPTKRQGVSGNNESSRNRRGGGDEALADEASSCVQKKFPSENSEAIPGDQPPRCFFQFCREKLSPPRPYSPSSSAFRFYILSFSLFPRRLYVARRGRRKKSTLLAQIFLFMYTWHIKISTLRIIRVVC